MSAKPRFQVVSFKADGNKDEIFDFEQRRYAIEKLIELEDANVAAIIADNEQGGRIVGETKQFLKD